MKKALIYIIFLTNLVLLFWFWYQNSGDFLLGGEFSAIMVALGRVTGLLAEFFILTQLVLIGRIRWIERVFGHPRLTALHRVVGTYIAIFLISHPIFLTIGWAGMTESGYLEQFTSFLTNWEHVLLAFVGLILFILTIVLSLPPVRRKLKYEHWHFTHLFMYAAIVLAFLHQIETGDVSSGTPFYYWITLNFTVFGLMLFFRFATPIYVSLRHDFKVEKIVSESNDVWSIYISGKNMHQFHFCAGQFAELSFLKWGFSINHPFSFSACPNGSYLRFTIKALGDFTNKIKDLTPGTRVIIDGPLGNFTEKECCTGKYLFIAGGVGITPIAGMIESLEKKNLANDVYLIYCVRTATQIPFRDYFDKLPIKTFYVVSDHGAGDGGKNYISGLLTPEKIKELCPNFRERDIYFCGPPKMGESVVGALHKIGVPDRQIHYEKFAF